MSIDLKSLLIKIKDAAERYKVNEVNLLLDENPIINEVDVNSLNKAIKVYNHEFIRVNGFIQFIESKNDDNEEELIDLDDYDMSDDYYKDDKGIETCYISHNFFNSDSHIVAECYGVGDLDDVEDKPLDATKAVDDRHTRKQERRNRKHKNKGNTYDQSKAHNKVNENITQEHLQCRDRRSYSKNNKVESITQDSKNHEVFEPKIILSSFNKRLRRDSL